MQQSFNDRTPQASSDPIRDHLNVPQDYAGLSTDEILKEIYKRAERRLREATPSRLADNPSLSFDWDRLRPKLDFNNLFMRESLNSEDLKRLSKVSEAMWRFSPIDQEVALKVEYVTNLLTRPGITPTDEDRRLIGSASFRSKLFESGKGGELTEAEISRVNELYHLREEFDAALHEASKSTARGKEPSLESVRLGDSDMAWRYNPEKDRVEVLIEFGNLKGHWLLKSGSPRRFEEWILRDSPDSTKEIARAGLRIWNQLKAGGHYEDKAEFREIFEARFHDFLLAKFPGQEAVARSTKPGA